MPSEPGLTPEQELVRRAQEGDEAAFAVLVERHETRLHALIRLRIGPRLRRRFDVDDVLQETHMRAWSNICKFEGQEPGSFYGWLAGIAENVAREFFRRHVDVAGRSIKREQGHQGDGADGVDDRLTLLVATAGCPSTKFRRQERLARLEEALKQLTEDQREVIILARVRRLAIAEIAERMGRSREAVSTLLYRAARRLREVFETTGSLRLPTDAMERLDTLSRPTDGRRRD